MLSIYSDDANFIMAHWDTKDMMLLAHERQVMKTRKEKLGVL